MGKIIEIDGCVEVPDEITADDFHINVSYEELLKLGTDKYTVKLKSLPRGVSHVRIHPEQVDFLIEQLSSDGN